MFDVQSVNIRNYRFRLLWAKLRVGIISEYPPFSFGGIGTFTRNLSEALATASTDVLVVAARPTRSPTQILDKTQRLRILWVPRVSLLPRHMWFQLTNIDLISRELSACDVVHGQDIYAFPLLQLFKRRRLKTPWVITFHTNPQAELHFTLNSLMKGSSLTDLVTYGAGFPFWDMTVRQHIKHADSLVSVSGSLREELSRGYRVDKERLKVIHTCVSTNDLRTLQTSTHLRPSKGTVRLFYAGRLYYRKGILQLMRIVADIVNQPEGRNIRLDIFGRGPLESVLKKYAADHLREISVAIRGHVDRTTLLQELSTSDIVCFPSLYEACPMLMIEAISMGKPVLAFDLPFAREILGNVEELLATNTSDFRVKLVRLISSQNERLSLGRRVLKRARDFDAVKIAAEYRKVYVELM